MSEMTTPTSPHTSPQTHRQVILPEDRVLVYDTDRFRWHQITDVLIGVRTKIRIAGMNEFFDQSLVAKHECATRREVRERDNL
jgi:hypothetical protein